MPKPIKILKEFDNCPECSRYDEQEYLNDFLDTHSMRFCNYCTHNETEGWDEKK